MIDPESNLTPEAQVAMQSARKHLDDGWGSSRVVAASLLVASAFIHELAALRVAVERKG